MRNRLQLTAAGRIVKDATVNAATGGHLIGFTVAANYKQKGEDITTYIDCTYYRTESSGTKIAEYLKKGAFVIVQGMPKADHFTTKAGEIKAVLRLNVDNIDILIYANESTSSQAAVERTSKGTDDLPF